MDEVTFHRFYSEVRYFLSKLISEPINADISQFLKRNGIKRSTLINDLMKRGVLKRHETIKDQFNSEYEKPTYVVKYSVTKKNFERNIKRLFSKYFEKNLPKKETKEMLFIPKLNENLQRTVFANEDAEAEKMSKIDPAYNKRGGLNKRINEDGEGGMLGDASRGSYDAPLFKNSDGSSDVVRKQKKIYMTEKQFEYIKSILDECNAGDIAILNEEGEIAGATSDNPGEYVGKPGNIGGFADKGDGFFNSKTHSNPIVKKK